MGWPPLSRASIGHGNHEEWPMFLRKSEGRMLDYIYCNNVKYIPFIW